MIRLVLACGASLAAVLVALWLLSVRRRDASLIDILWGPSYVLVAWLSFWLGGGSGGRRLLLAAMVSVWGLRLGIHLARRNLGKGEDRRYAAMRAHWGARFWWVSLFTVFAFQGLLVLVIALPVMRTMHAAPQPPLGGLDAAAVAVWMVGLLFEAVGDWQLRRFLADPVNRGRVLDRGLWRATRHPNYFGDFCVWWGHFLVAATLPGPALTVVSPLVMSFLLLRVSGVPMLEKDIGARRPGYAEYVARTRAFFPWFPRRPREGAKREIGEP